MDKSKFNSKSDWKKFGIGLGVILAIIGLVLLLNKKSDSYIYLFGAGLLSILAALVSPIIIKPVFIFFSYFGHYMGWVVTRVILIALYFLVISPIRLVSRLVGKKFLDLDIRREEKSYWIVKQPGVRVDGPGDKENIVGYENQF